jgi:hypothetical protein
VDPSGHRPSLEVLVRITNEFGGKEGKAVAALAYKLPEPWTSGEAKQVLDTALTSVTRLGDYEFDPHIRHRKGDLTVERFVPKRWSRGKNCWRPRRSIT